MCFIAMPEVRFFQINSCPLCRTEFPSDPHPQIVRAPNAESEVRTIQENQERASIPSTPAEYAYGYPEQWSAQNQESRPRGQNLTAYANPPRLRGQNATAAYAYTPERWNLNGIFL